VRRLFAPWRPERVDLFSDRPPAEVLAAIAAATTRRPLLTAAFGVSFGGGVDRSGGPARLVLAVRRPYGDPAAPVAVVALAEDGQGTRVRGEIRPSGLGQAWTGSCALVGGLATVVGLAALAWPALVVGAVFLAMAVGAPWVSYRERATLRALLADVV